MNRRGDCICAITSFPPELHHPQCPIRKRAGEGDRRLRRSAADLLPPYQVLQVESGDWEVLDGRGVRVLQTPHEQFAGLLQLLLTSWSAGRQALSADGHTVVFPGAGGDQAPRKAPEAPDGPAGVQRPGPTAPTPSHPDQPTGRGGPR